MNRIVIRIIDGMIEQVTASEPTEILVLDDYADEPLDNVATIDGEQWIVGYPPIEVEPESVALDFQQAQG